MWTYLFSFGFLLSIWTFCGFEFCYKTSVLTMSSQDKIKRKSTEEKCFCRHFFRDCLPLFVKWRQGCLSLDEDLLLLRMLVFLHNSRIHHMGVLFLCNSSFLKIYFIFNTETVGSHTSSGRDSLHVARRQRKQWRQFDCHKAYHMSGSYSQAFGSKDLTTSCSAE